MFLDFDDYKAVSDPQSLDIISQSDSDNLQRAERYAIEEISGYLRAAKTTAQATGLAPVRIYDVEATFAATGADRNAQLVMYCCDVALYHLVSWLPKRIGFEIRKERYERAIKWLESVQAGNVLLNIPFVPMPSPEEQAAQNPLRYGSMEPAVYDY
ncbi:MAG: DUF1320 domain-containing protein [Dysgonamonadaceae bacterium]|jgi:hypothetical protein|nr:DUF1320 domain-containing protein [Dysgonamonadaceae bacterium]